jgi:hypothetical protein
MYDNTSSMALTGSGVTIMGQAAGLTVLAIGGALLVGLGAVLAITERLRRKR